MLYNRSCASRWFQWSYAGVWAHARCGEMLWDRMKKPNLDLEMRVMSAYEQFRSLPARIPSETVADLLGFEKHEITVLVSSKLLKPLGKPAPNGPKHFAKIEIFRLVSDTDWLSQATKAITTNWKAKNSRKTEHLEQNQALAAWRISPTTQRVNPWHMFLALALLL